MILEAASQARAPVDTVLQADTHTVAQLPVSDGPTELEDLARGFGNLLGDGPAQPSHLPSPTGLVIAPETVTEAGPADRTPDASMARDTTPQRMSPLATDREHEERIVTITQEELAPGTAAPLDDSGVAALNQQATVFLDDITMRVGETPGVPPPPQSRQRRPHNRTVNTPLRRSRRIAASGSAATSIQRAQLVLMKRLGLPVEQNATPQDVEAYARLFDHPLSPSHIAALAALFGWTVPDNSEARQATLLGD